MINSCTVVDYFLFSTVVNITFKVNMKSIFTSVIHISGVNVNDSSVHDIQKRCLSS